MTNKISFFYVCQPVSEYRLTSRAYRESVRREGSKIGKMVPSGGTATHCWMLYAFVQEMVSRIRGKVATEFLKTDLL